MHAELRKLPAVDALLREPSIAALAQEYGHLPLAAVVRAALDEQRDAIRVGAAAPDPAAWPALVAAAVVQWSTPSLLPLINATGVIIHTNLGRAPLSIAARRAVDALAAGYSNLEYDLEAGARGSRHDHARRRLCRITGAEDALVVNNNAAALFLSLTALCGGKEVLIGRGQLVEIGGGFRIPDVLRQGGAHLVEVGTTNRTHPHDFTAALTSNTGAILRVHSSNFKQIGFVTEPSLDELAAIAHRYTPEEGDTQGRGASSTRAVILIDDLGSGTLLDTAVYGLAPEPMVQQSLAAGADLVTFSGDKLLGGPQAGIIVGRGALIERVRRHPLARALRVDKMTLAALDATLASYEQGRAHEEIPVWQMISAPVAALRHRVEQWREKLIDPIGAARLELWETHSAVGGGSLPGETLPSVALALAAPQPHALAARLRRQQPPLIGRIQDDRLLFDARTVLPEQDAQVSTLIASAYADAARETTP